MNNELNFQENIPQATFQNEINNVNFNAPQNAVGGTTNYNGLSNKPKINNVELIGNKTLEDLGIKQEYTANDIKFADGNTFQDKYNSGELNGTNGKDGYTPIKGIDYFDGKNGTNGKDGYTPIKNKDYFDGKNGVDGKDGYTPVKGVDYFDGKDGKTPVKGIDYFDGKDGKDGADGKTPIKGTDYYTEADKQEIVQLVLNEIPSSEGVSY